MKSHIRANLVSVGYATKVIEKAYKHITVCYDNQLRIYGETITASSKLDKIYDALILRSNERTIEAAKKLIASESLAESSIASIYVLEARILLALVLLGSYQPEDMLCIANDEKTFNNVLEFFLIGLNWKLGHTVDLHVIPGINFIQLTNDVNCKDTVKFEINNSNIVLTSNNSPIM